MKGSISVESDLGQGSTFTAVIPQKAASAFYLVRCRKFRETPPPADWDGVFNFNEK